MNIDIQKLHPYPFEQLAKLKGDIQPKMSPIALSIGEPKHEAPKFALEALVNSMDGFSEYPKTQGRLQLRQLISRWLVQRFSLQGIDPEQIIPVSGTREALFSFTQAVVDRTKDQPTVLIPNPFYQIYEGAAYLAGADLIYLDCLEENGFQPDFDSISEEQWQKCQLLFVCTPGNPTGAVMDMADLQKLIRLADEYDFIIASDECYSEIYMDEYVAPAGLLQACAEMGRHDFKRCVVFHSLSKRSNVPGLRSGFVAGDADIMATYLKYRTYHGCALPVPVQIASEALWQDEGHVIENRRLYRNKFQSFKEILKDCWPLTMPDAGFYFWAKTPFDDLAFTKGLFEHKNVTLLPGQFLSRAPNGTNPGLGFVRMALVATEDECNEAANRIRDFILSQPC